jgi:hypothetical protein
MLQPAAWNLRSRREDVVVGGRPTTLLVRPTTPLFAERANAPSR